MSLRTRINGFTSWVNLRLKPYNMLMNNVIMDLLKGTNLKMLLQSMTGIDNKKLQNFDGMTQQQKTTRVEWIVKELKESEVIPDDVFVDCRLFAMRHADHVFDLLWRLSSHDIWFTWERLEYLMHGDDKILCEVPFEWTPRPPPEKKKKKKVKYNKSLLSGFGGASLVAETHPSSPEPPEPVTAVKGPLHIKYPGEDFCKKFKPSKKSWPQPSPEDCIMEMVNTLLKTTREGRKLNVERLDDLVDSRVLCALVNAFVPGTFTSEVMLNDRWTINLALRTFDKLVRIVTPVDSQDLVEADAMAVSTYMAVFFMCGFKLRQSKAVLGRLKELEHLTRAAKHELDALPEILSDVDMIQKRKKLNEVLQGYETEVTKIKSKFDVKACEDWRKHVANIQAETREIVSKKMRDRFDALTIPRGATINDLCLSLVVNLTLTNGSGFYLSKGREMVTPDRRIVLRDLSTGEFIDDFTHGKGVSKFNIRKMLGISSYDVVEINPNDHPQFEIFLESPSKNKLLKTGAVFLYQVFPGNFSQWEGLFFKACKLGELDIVQKMVVFFRDKRPGFINAKEKKTGNSALHMAARNGHYDILLFLLENGAHIDARNANLASAFFNAVEGLNRGISQGHHNNAAELLVEWGTNIYVKNKQGRTAFDVVRSDEQKNTIVEYYDHLQACIPKLMRGDTQLLKKLVEDHVSGVLRFASLRSRCINGSTLLHTAAYFGVIPVVKELLKERVDVNLLDYKGATPLHRARDQMTIRLLLESGAELNAIDSEGNTPLHVKCYGEAGKATPIDCIKELLAENINLIHRNHKELLAIHCCAMQGRVDAIQLLLDADPTETIRDSLGREDPKSPPSLPHLALANDFLKCGAWLVEQGFSFKEHEQDILVHRILTEQIKSKQRLDMMRFLFEHGADLDQRYSGGNTPLHYAAGMTGPTDILELLIEYGADVDAVNEDICSPLFFATQANNYYGASILLQAGANVRHKNLQGLTAFDCILDFDEWLECGFFTDEIKARLKAYSLKHARDLVRAITQKVKGHHGKGLYAQVSALSLGVGGGGASPQRNLALSASLRQRKLNNSPSSQMMRGSNTGTLPPLRPRGFLTK
ncbi:uncharacterized protein LOC110977993 isoform X2 [Acanthaster planci]|uniref:Uncharacterized protein LOC110977993 isoform X2 n=1 Tax=Acanthaster planci TaxID=133434 RepID=A0A8B7Y979_ACAPL|nr:uncharacterized protein LOC110977993 isoform X2 [Acanthaster planci]